MKKEEKDKRRRRTNGGHETASKEIGKNGKRKRNVEHGERKIR